MGAVQTAEFDIVCVSHLRWDFVWQRPQHLMRRLGAFHRVLFVEEPLRIPEAEAPGLNITARSPSISVVRFDVPHPKERPLWFNSRWQPRYERALTALVQDWRERPLVLWMYTPLPFSLVEILQPDVVVYDVMDELSAFRVADPNLSGLEQKLLARADVVFTGGVSIYRSKRAYNPNTHLFPSGVDQAHFAAALSPSTQVPEDIATLHRPVLGFYGVIDERIDLKLLSAAARLTPEWEWVMIGPVLKIAPSSLPRRRNLHYLGPRDYSTLPAYLKGFDVAIMPFALNEATRYISPTKTLEYLAADRSVVSTHVPDVVELYGEVVRFGSTPEEFVAQCRAALAESDEDRASRREIQRALLVEHSWDDIAARMEELTLDALCSRDLVQAGAAWA